MFKVGDIVRDKKSIARYIVTGIHRYSSGNVYWTGITKNGVSQGGTIFGNDNFDDFEVIGYFDITPMYQAVEDAWQEWHNQRFKEGT